MRHLPFMPDLGSFPAGTRLHTTVGEVPVEEIYPGEQLITLDGEMVTVDRVTCRSVRFRKRSDRGKPVLIPAGAIGGGFPARELVLPPHQLVGFADLSPVDQPGRVDVLIPAASLTTLPGARVMKGRRQMMLYSVITDRPALIYAEGTVTETTRPLSSRLAFSVTGGLFGGRVHHRSGIRVLSEAAGSRLIGRLRRAGDLPSRPRGDRKSDFSQWDLDLALERTMADARRRKTG